MAAEHTRRTGKDRDELIKRQQEELASLRDRFGLRVTPGSLVHTLHRAARVAPPAYDALCAQIRGSPVVSLDDTGWRVGAVLHESSPFLVKTLHGS